MNPTRIGPFVLEDNLRPDGKGSVFRGFHTKQRRNAAVKVLSAPLAAASVSACQEFSQEGKTLVELRHPHIARCYGGALDQMQGYLVHELIEGESLAALLARRERLTWDSALEITSQVCAALEHAHSAGFVHGLLSPEKILITEPLGEVKVLDFRVDRHSNPFTSTAAPSDNPFAYLAPEQLGSQPTTTVKIDLFSLGAILFHAISGQLPHQASTREEMLELRRTLRPPRLSSLALDCPVWLDDIVAQLLEPEPTDRPYGAGAVSLAFREASKKVTQRTGAVEHAAGGFSPLRRSLDNEEAKRLLGVNEVEPKPERRPFRIAIPGLLENTLFLVGALVIILGLTVWGFWPLSEQQLFDRGQALMATEDISDWNRARSSYFEPLLARFPDTAHAEEVRRQVDRISMRQAFNRMKLNYRLTRDPRSEGEAFYRKGWLAEEQGEETEALLVFRQMLREIEETEDNRPFLLLAQDRIDELSKQLLARPPLPEKSTDQDALIAPDVEESSVPPEKKTSPETP
ncbi:serine/threonine-protein kinase [Lignipirellula cremea]|uniref:Serine/threonine-protein kinase PK-1 n=1 Tax=Lignipirellula cremea TaxID=2528010 RepID=A0A518DMB8_9BACT|nr:serine/threonine-protein kinase [Lignipirellula cremea]QDU92985.1 Serine/threonine-protein kinase PK-1 [Lignipirellula cremea]